MVITTTLTSMGLGDRGPDTQAVSRTVKTNAATLARFIFDLDTRIPRRYANWKGSRESHPWLPAPTC
jgi:hypothetical protein